MSSFVRRAVVGTFAFLRSMWLIIGITLILIVLLETTVRARRAWASRSSGPPTFLDGDPRKTEAWVVDFYREFLKAQKLSWRSYVYFRRIPFDGKEIDIDTLGRRFTPQPTVPAQPIARVHMYGGSTMWGEPLRAANTIPAEVARRLQPLAGTGQRIEVTNVGETGYVFTQEVLQLMMDLRRGERPDVVVFYDGINDIAAAVQRGVAGDPQNETRRVAEFQFGRELDVSPDETPLHRDTRVTGLLGKMMLDRLALVQWAKSRNPAPARTFVAADSLASSMVRVYEQNARLVEFMGKQYGFIPVYVWQPIFHISEKPLTALEKNLRTSMAKDSFQVRVAQVHAQVPARIDSVMHLVAPDRFIDASRLFKDDARPVYVDRVGHNTEQAIPIIVDAFWPTLSRETTKALAARQSLPAGKPLPGN